MWTNDTAKIKKQRFLNMSRETAYVGKNNTACLGIKMITREIKRTVTKYSEVSIIMQKWYKDDNIGSCLRVKKIIKRIILGLFLRKTQITVSEKQTQVAAPIVEICICPCSQKKHTVFF